MNTIFIIGIGLIIVVLVAVAAVGFISYGMGNRATVYETLNPNGVAVGTALVVYDPSITENTKNVATIIANDLQSRGYKVDLAGIKSKTAEKSSEYNIIVVGGSIYGGNSGAAVKSYIETLKTTSSTKIGVFATGDPHTTDEAEIKNHIVPATGNSTLQINAVMAVTMNDDKTRKCTEFVDKLLR
jgi:flavodoxin